LRVECGLLLFFMATLKKIMLPVLLLLIAGVSTAGGQEPMDTLKRAVDGGYAILNDSRLRDAGRRQEQKKALWEVLQQVFDFHEFSRRVLGAGWKKFSRQQQKRFTRAFERFLGNYYLARLQERYTGETVRFINQDRSSPTRAVVHLELTWKARQIPVAVRMIRRSGAWKAYDIIVLGVSAVSNYRAQFRELLRRRSPEEVIAHVEQKAAGAEPKTP